MFFDDWQGLLRVVVVGVCAYAALVVMLRVSGKRTLSKLNAFDFVVTVALGSILASILTNEGVVLAEGLAALALLILLQLAVAWLAARWHRFNEILKSEPRVLFYRGAFLRGAMRRERITEEGVLAAVRARGIEQLDRVEAVVLESNGDLSVIAGSGEPAERSALRSVQGPPARREPSGPPRSQRH